MDWCVGPAVCAGLKSSAASGRKWAPSFPSSSFQHRLRYASFPRLRSTRNIPLGLTLHQSAGENPFMFSKDARPGSTHTLLATRPREAPARVCWACPQWSWDFSLTETHFSRAISKTPLMTVTGHLLTLHMSRSLPGGFRFTWFELGFRNLLF